MIARFTMGAAALIITTFSLAVDEVSEEALPTGYPVTRYSAIWENSPFTREVIRPAKTTSASAFGKNMVLRGLLIDSQEGPIAYVRDNKENQILRITSAGSSRGFPYTLVSADKQANPKDTVVVITDGKEEAEIGYEENALTAAIRAPQQQVRTDPKQQQAGGNAAARVREQQLRNQEAAKRAQQNKTTPPASIRQTSSTSNPPKPEIKDSFEALDDVPKRRSVPLPKGSGD
jgi:hypothetical protein